MMYFLIAIIVFGLIVLIVLSRLMPVRRTKLNQEYFAQQWAQLLARVKTPEGMVLAVIDADKLRCADTKRSPIVLPLK